MNSGSKKLTIILDIDDTLCPLLEVVAEILRQRHAGDSGFRIAYEDFIEWDFLNFPVDIQAEIWEILRSDEIYERQTPFPGAVELVQELQRRGHRVLIYSAVSPHKMGIRAKIIMQYFPVQERDIILGGNKDLMWADILLDDGLHNILTSHCQYPILIRRPWNLKEKQVLSVGNYDEFLAMVDQIEKIAPMFRTHPVRDKQPSFIALVGPPSSGKTSVINELLHDPRFVLAPAVTTRLPKDDDRPGEYVHVSQEEFDRLASSRLLLEHTVYYGERYGISQDAFQPIWDNGQIPVKAMDIRGAMEIKRVMGSRCMTIFIRRNRQYIIKNLVEDSTDPDLAARKIMGLDGEFASEHLCDYVIANNGDLAETVRQLFKIID